MQNTTEKLLIGAKEWCCFPALAVTAVKARIDSGAKISSLHAVNIEPFVRSASEWVRFSIHPLQQNSDLTITCEAPVTDRRIIRSSNGTGEERIIINTPLTLHGNTWNIDVSLTNRQRMTYRMLLGREAMAGRLLIDSDKSFMAGKLSAAQLEVLYGASAKKSADVRSIEAQH